MPGSHYPTDRIALEAVLDGQSVDVLLCQPFLTLRIPYDRQESPVREFFDTTSSNLLGDDPFESNNGILKLAADLRASGVKVAYLDLHSLDLRHRRLTGQPMPINAAIELLSKYEYQVLGLSMMAIAEQAGSDLANASKALHPDATVVAGGLLPSAVPEVVRNRTPAIDQCLTTDGLTEILRILKREPATSPRNTKRAFDLVPVGFPILPRVFTSYGCPKACAFCSPIRIKQAGPLKTASANAQAAEFLNDVAAIRESYQTDFFVFGNLSFLAGTELDEIVCRRLAKGDLEPVRFWCQMRPDDVTESKSALLRDAGCIQVAVGIESANPQVNDAHGKCYKTHGRAYRSWIRERLSWLKSCDITTYGYFMLGMPGEDAESVGQTTDFVMHLLEIELLDSVHLSIPVPYPGTPWYHSPEKYGLEILHHEFSRYWMNCDPLGYGEPVFATDRLSETDVYQLWATAVRRSTEILRRRQRTAGRLYNVINSVPASHALEVVMPG